MPSGIPPMEGDAGYAESEIEPHSSILRNLLHPDDRAPFDDALDAVLRGEREYEMEFRLRHKDGRYVDILSCGFPIRREPAGPIVRIVGTHFDLTERKRAERRCGKASVCTGPSANPSTTVYGCARPTAATPMPANRS